MRGHDEDTGGADAVGQRGQVLLGAGVDPVEVLGT
jgi:hypothetical protein